jgi:hypothetical protein
MRYNMESTISLMTGIPLAYLSRKAQAGASVYWTQTDAPDRPR